MSDDHDHDRDRDHAANDNGEHEKTEGKPVAPATTTKGELTSSASIKALQTALAGVNTAAIIGRTGRPMMLFKSREAGGTWGFGQKRTIPEEGSRWAANPMTFQWGYISFGDNKKVAGEVMASVTKPKPDFATLPNTGFPWAEQWSVCMKCLDGADAGVEVIFKGTTDGGLKAIVILLDQVRDRIDGGQHDGKIVPIVLLERDSYPHAKYGPTAIPVLNIVDWMSLDGPAPASAPAPAPESPSPPEQPRRRRVA